MAVRPWPWARSISPSIEQRPSTTVVNPHRTRGQSPDPDSREYVGPAKVHPVLPTALRRAPHLYSQEEQCTVKSPNQLLPKPPPPPPHVKRMFGPPSAPTNTSLLFRLEESHDFQNATALGSKVNLESAVEDDYEEQFPSLSPMRSASRDRTVIDIRTPNDHELRAESDSDGTATPSEPDGAQVIQRQRLAQRAARGMHRDIQICGGLLFLPWWSMPWRRPWHWRRRATYYGWRKPGPLILIILLSVAACAITLSALLINRWFTAQGPQAAMPFWNLPDESGPKIALSNTTLALVKARSEVQLHIGISQFCYPGQCYQKTEVAFAAESSCGRSSLSVQGFYQATWVALVLAMLCGFLTIFHTVCAYFQPHDVAMRAAARSERHLAALTLMERKAQCRSGLHHSSACHDAGGNQDLDSVWWRSIASQDLEKLKKTRHVQLRALAAARGEDRGDRDSDHGDSSDSGDVYDLKEKLESQFNDHETIPTKALIQRDIRGALPGYASQSSLNTKAVWNQGLVREAEDAELGLGPDDIPNTSKKKKKSKRISRRTPVEEKVEEDKANEHTSIRPIKWPFVAFLFCGIGIAMCTLNQEVWNHCGKTTCDVIRERAAVIYNRTAATGPFFDPFGREPTPLVSCGFGTSFLLTVLSAVLYLFAVCTGLYTVCRNGVLRVAAKRESRSLQLGRSAIDAEEFVARVDLLRRESLARQGLELISFKLSKSLRIDEKNDFVRDIFFLPWYAWQTAELLGRDEIRVNEHRKFVRKIWRQARAEKRKILEKEGLTEKKQYRYHMKKVMAKNLLAEQQGISADDVESPDVSDVNTSDISLHPAEIDEDDLASDVPWKVVAVARPRRRSRSKEHGKDVAEEWSSVDVSSSQGDWEPDDGAGVKSIEVFPIVGRHHRRGQAQTEPDGTEDKPFQFHEKKATEDHLHVHQKIATTAAEKEDAFNFPSMSAGGVSFLESVYGYKPRKGQYLIPSQQQHRDSPPPELARSTTSSQREVDLKTPPDQMQRRGPVAAAEDDSIALHPSQPKSGWALLRKHLNEFPTNQEPPVPQEELVASLKRSTPTTAEVVSAPRDELFRQAQRKLQAIAYLRQAAARRRLAESHSPSAAGTPTTAMERFPSATPPPAGHDFWGYEEVSQRLDALRFLSASNSEKPRHSDSETRLREFR